MKFKLGDTVAVTTGKDKGKQGKITRIFPAGATVLVEGLGQYSRQLKPSQTGGPGKIVTRFRPFASAKIALVCPKCHKPTRIGFSVDKQGAKTRLCRKCQGVL